MVHSYPCPWLPPKADENSQFFFKKIKHCYFIVIATAVLLALKQGCWTSKPKLFNLLHLCPRQSSLYQRQSWGCHCVWASVWVTVSKQYEKIQSEKKIRILTVERFFSQLLWFGPIWEEISFWMKSHILIGENHPPSFSMFQAGAWNRCKQVAVSHPTGLEVGRAGRNVHCRATSPACDSLPADISLQVIKYTLGVLKQEVKIQAWVRSYSPAPRHALLYML